MMIAWWVRGLARPSPFFDDAGSPHAEPRVLTKSERADLAVAATRGVAKTGG
jgi:hypothetical protein